MSKKVNVDRIFKGAKPPAKLTDADMQRIDSMFRDLAKAIALLSIALNFILIGVLLR